MIKAPTNSEVDDCQPISTGWLMPSSSARLVEANWRQSARYIAPLRKAGSRQRHCGVGTGRRRDPDPIHGTGPSPMCNDFGNKIPYSEYLAAFSQTRIPVKWRNEASNL